MQSLSELRNAYINLSFQHSTIAHAMETDKTEAKLLASQIKEGYLSDYPVAHLEDDLFSIENRFKSRKAELHKLDARLNKVSDSIADYYRLVENGKWELDWSVRLETGSVWSGWDQRYKQGSLLIVDTELCSAELSILAEIANVRDIKLVKWENQYKLLAQYPAYRDTCWTDFDGMKLMDRLSSLFKERFEKVNKSPLFALEVLS